MKPVHVIGGGLAGLTAATLLARGGRAVTLYEKSELGGRARTQSENGALFNQGPHALYRGGRAMQVLRELGLKPDGKIPPTSGLFAWHRDALHALPVGPVTLLSTSLLSLPEGCAFAARCAHRFALCDQRPELLDKAGDGHLDACHLSPRQKQELRETTIHPELIETAE